jgi:hypothetical protein
MGTVENRTGFLIEFLTISFEIFAQEDRPAGKFLLAFTSTVILDF